ncbi:MAG: UbiD family decarboxylase [Desulfurococcaceae archaeon]
MELDQLMGFAKKLDKQILDAGYLDEECSVTNLSLKNRDKLILFKLKRSEEILCYTNLITTRRDVYKLFDKHSDEELYNYVNKAIDIYPPDINVVDFRNYFEEIAPDLSVLPFIKYYKEDGGYYLTSSIYVACVDNICNSSFHRTMFLTRNEAVLRVVPRHLHYIMNSYLERDEDTPVAMILGVHPLQELAAALSPPLGVFEVYVGVNLTRDPKICRTPLYNIPIPADASIVIEGVILKNKRAPEGPFTDILSLLDPRREQPVFRAEAMYFNKKKPLIYHAIVPGLWEHRFLMGFPREIAIYNYVKKIVPGLKSVRLTDGGSGWLHAVLSIKQLSPGDARLAGIATIYAHPSVKHVVVVDDDIDIDNPEMVEWAIATRMKSGEDIIILRDIRGSTLDPRSKDGVGDKAIFIAVKPFDEPWDKYKRVTVP